MKLEPGKPDYDFVPAGVIVKIACKKRSNWRMDVKELPLVTMQHCHKSTPATRGTPCSYALDPEKKKLWLYPTPADADELEIEYAAKLEGAPPIPEPPASKRPTLHIPTLGRKP